MYARARERGKNMPRLFMHSFSQKVLLNMQKYRIEKKQHVLVYVCWWVCFYVCTQAYIVTRATIFTRDKNEKNH